MRSPFCCAGRGSTTSCLCNLAAAEPLRSAAEVCNLRARWRQPAWIIIEGKKRDFSFHAPAAGAARLPTTAAALPFCFLTAQPGERSCDATCWSMRACVRAWRAASRPTQAGPRGTRVGREMMRARRIVSSVGSHGRKKRLHRERMCPSHCAVFSNVGL